MIQPRSKQTTKTSKPKFIIYNITDTLDSIQVTKEYYKHIYRGNKVTDYRHFASISSSVSPLVSGTMKYMNTRDATAIAENM